MRSYWNKNVKRVLAIVVGAIGFTAACVTLYPWTIAKIFPEDGIELIPDSHQSPVVLNSDDLNSPVVYPRVRIDSELASQNQVQIVTNELVIESEGKLVAPHITIFATRVSGGTLDVRGSDAQQHGASGGNAGTIFIVAANVKDTNIVASGGIGKNGSKGEDGSQGRTGRCTSRLIERKKWIGATDGGSGSNGKDGGNGGNGGDVTLLLAINEHPYQPQPNVNGGKRGEGGPGGTGGRGGRGCTGLGGFQADHPDGSDGSRGYSGIDGEMGTFVSRNINFRNVKKILVDVKSWDTNKWKLARKTISGEE